MHEALIPTSDFEAVRGLRRPVLLSAFAGWGDPGGTAASAIRYLAHHWEATAVAELDPEPFYDFSVLRPVVRLEEGERVLDWPRNRFFAASPPGADCDFLLLVGTEPHFRWRAFSEAIAEVMAAADVEASVNLGVLGAAVPHTRPTPLRLNTVDAGLEQRFGLERHESRYEGPTGIAGVLSLDHRRRGYPQAGLRAMAPHYLGAVPQPYAMFALAERISDAYHAPTPLDELRESVRLLDEQVEQAMAQSMELRSFVTALEEQYDAIRGSSDGRQTGGGEAGELAASQGLIEDLERFLRQQRDVSGPGPTSPPR